MMLLFKYLYFLIFILIQYDELNKKRQIVLKDRSMLETTIQELEQVKIDVLQNAFSQINKVNSNKVTLNPQ
jgi:hypothetical protein